MHLCLLGCRDLREDWHFSSRRRSSSPVASMDFFASPPKSWALQHLPAAGRKNRAGIDLNQR
jgi:hypothetical protein